MTNRTPLARLVVLISGAGSTMAAIETATRDVDYGAIVVAVVSDQPAAPGLDYARAAGIPTVVVDREDFASRTQWDAALAAAIVPFDPDLVVLAGFMKIVGAAVLEAFDGRIVNTHPALLPAFPGAHAVRDALDAGVKVTGCSVIVVDAGVDTGPIVAQAAVPVQPGDSVETLHERIKSVERGLVVDTVGAMVREGWQVTGRQVTIGRKAQQ